MGADYLQAALPNVNFTELRVAELHKLITEMESSSVSSSDDTAEVADGFIELHRIVDELPDFAARRDVLVTTDSKFMETGGESYGDAPTEAYSMLSKLYDADSLIQAIDRYSIEDRVMRLSESLTPSLAEKFLQLLTDGTKAGCAVVDWLNSLVINDAEVATPDVLEYARQARDVLNQVISTLDPTDQHPTRVVTPGTPVEVHFFENRRLSQQDAAYISAAIGHIDGEEVSIDDLAAVLHVDGGAHVSAWVWVNEEELVEGEREVPEVKQPDPTQVRLLNGSVIRSGVVDPDGTTLTAGDYLSVETITGKQVFRAETSDICGDYTVAQRLINQFMQACQ